MAVEAVGALLFMLSLKVSSRLTPTALKSRPMSLLNIWLIQNRASCLRHKLKGLCCHGVNGLDTLKLFLQCAKKFKRSAY